MILSAQHLRVRYRNGALGVLDVSFDVDEGQIVALFGPNGAGKTTSVRAVSGFLKTEGAKVISGRVELFGENMTNNEPHKMTRAGLAFVPERRKVFPNMSVMENLSALGKRPPRARRTEVYDRVFELFPVLRERRKQQAGRLSGGQRQMLAIARAIVSEPKLLIIDEMTLGLHHSMHAPLFEAVSQVAATGTAVVMVDESTGFALKAADHCYLINGGRIRDQGPAERFRGNELLAAGYVEALQDA
jgi:branched-chain amino acid transport system ATP-binding protein